MTATGSLSSVTAPFLLYCILGQFFNGCGVGPKLLPVLPDNTTIAVYRHHKVEEDLLKHQTFVLLKQVIKLKKWNQNSSIFEYV